MVRYRLTQRNKSIDRLIPVVIHTGRYTLATAARPDDTLQHLQFNFAYKFLSLPVILTSDPQASTTPHSANFILS